MGLLDVTVVVLDASTLHASCLAKHEHENPTFIRGGGKVLQEAYYSYRPRKRLALKNPASDDL